MNNKILTIIIIVALFIGGYFVLSSPKENQEMAKDAPTAQDTVVVPDSMEKEAMDDAEVAEKDMSLETGEMFEAMYVDYTAEEVESTKKGDKTVLFFHATWCPTCKAADMEITKNISKLPKNLKILKTDYDKEKALKTIYGITYQHTFVQVDTNGEMITKWSGGGVDTIIENLK